MQREHNSETKVNGTQFDSRSRAVKRMNWTESSRGHLLPSAQSAGVQLQPGGAPPWGSTHSQLWLLTSQGCGGPLLAPHLSRAPPPPLGAAAQELTLRKPMGQGMPVPKAGSRRGQARCAVGAAGLPDARQGCRPWDVWAGGPQPPPCDPPYQPQSALSRSRGTPRARRGRRPPGARRLRSSLACSRSTQLGPLQPRPAQPLPRAPRAVSRPSSPGDAARRARGASAQIARCGAQASPGGGLPAGGSWRGAAPW